MTKAMVGRAHYPESLKGQVFLSVFFCEGRRTCSTPATNGSTSKNKQGGRLPPNHRLHNRYYKGPDVRVQHRANHIGRILRMRRSDKHLWPCSTVGRRPVDRPISGCCHLSSVILQMAVKALKDWNVPYTNAPYSSREG